MALTKEQIKEVKGRGFLLNRGTECFSGRVISAGGAYTSADLRTISECAERFGRGEVLFTSRQSAEITGIPYESIKEAEGFLAANGLSFGGTGAKVRPVTACKGTVCVYGNIDTLRLSKQLHEYFYIGMRDISMPHKVKIGVGGCPNSCMKPSLNDIGVEGVRPVVFNSALCRSCGKCAVMLACPSHAIVKTEEGVAYDHRHCTMCGVCVSKCPFGAMPKALDPMCRIYVGGTWGKTRRMGTPLSYLVPEDKVIETVEKIYLFYRKHGYVGERLGKTVDRVGTALLEEEIKGDLLLTEKQAILSMPLLVKENA